MTETDPPHDPDHPIRAFRLTREEAEDRRQGGDIEDIFFKGEGRPANKWIDYLPIYERYFSPFRDAGPTLLEIGVGQGGSLDLWRRYFGPDATICGIDVKPVCATRVSPPNLVRIGSQDDERFLKSVIGEIGPPDIILDDGSHMAAHQTAGFRILWPELKDGGLYVIEDTHTAYWNEFGGGYRKDGTAIDLAARLIDDMHAWFHQQATEFAAREEIAAVHAHESILIIEKRKKARPGHIRIGRKN
ncbi:MAG: class I SAM-dependent methyltransferase [Alphaproteobacteria bacterium]